MKRAARHNMRITRQTRAAADCKLNLRDMGATSGEGYSHSTVGLSKGRWNGRTVALTDVVCFSCSFTVAPGERFAEVLRFDVGDAGLPVESLASLFSYGLP